MGREGPAHIGTRGLGKSRRRGSQTPRHFLFDVRQKGPVQQCLVPLALAWLVLGSRRSETGLCEIGSGELARGRRGHETRATRQGLSINQLLA